MSFRQALKKTALGATMYTVGYPILFAAIARGKGHEYSVYALVVMGVVAGVGFWLTMAYLVYKKDMGK